MQRGGVFVDNQGMNVGWYGHNTLHRQLERFLMTVTVSFFV
jgi:hypothetical protein